MSVIESLLRGSIDMHVHCAPDPKAERRVDALECALQAQDAGMRAIVLKSHEYPTAPLAQIVKQVVQNIEVFGSLSLDLEIGGLNPHAVEASAKLGAKVCWMPTLTSANDMRKQGLNKEGVSILDEEGNLLPVVEEILELVEHNRMILATGHLSPRESFALVEEAKNMGIGKIIVTHPLLERLGAHLSLEEQHRMVEKGAFIEHCFSLTMPLRRVDPMKVVEAVRSVGAENCIMSTDMGQIYNPAPAEGMRMMIGTMFSCGLTEREIELLIKSNPAALLDLD